MRKARKFNKYPFMILMVIHTCLLIFTFYKNKDRKRLFILLLSNVSLAYHFEYIVLNLFNGYKYKPFILKNKSLDNIFGAILSQAVFVPFTALFITAFQLGWKAKWGASLYFTIVEMIFLRLKVYHHHWWRTVYTTLLLPVFFSISDLSYTYLKREYPYFLNSALYSLLSVTHINFLYVLAVIGKLKFGNRQGQFRLAPIYSICLSFLQTLLVRKGSLAIRVLVVGLSVVMDYVLVNLKWLKTKYKSFGYSVFFHVMMLFLGIQYKKLIFRKGN